MRLSQVLKSEAEFVRRCGDFVRESEIGSSHAGHQDVFNDTSIHSFPAERLPDGDWALWDRGPEPEYPESEQELIRDVQELAQVTPSGDAAVNARP